MINRRTTIRDAPLNVLMPPSPHKQVRKSEIRVKPRHLSQIPVQIPYQRHASHLRGTSATDTRGQMKKLVEKMLSKHGGSCVPDFGITGENIDFEGNFITCWQLLTDFISSTPKNERFKNLMSQLIDSKKRASKKRRARPALDLTLGDSPSRISMQRSEVSLTSIDYRQLCEEEAAEQEQRRPPEKNRLKAIREDFERLVR